MTGTISRRGKQSWQLKYDLPRDPQTRKRRFAYATVRGTRKDAEKELRRRLYALDKGVAVEPSRITLAEYIDSWLSDVAPRTVAPKALERYRGLAKHQIKPHLGVIRLQKLRPADIDAWLGALEKSGLSIRSIRHAHGCLRTALGHAAAIEIVERNVCKIIKPPKLERTEIEILTAEQITDALAKLDGHPFYPIAAFAIGTGARRGEIAALRWGDVDLDAAVCRIERSVEQTKEGLRIKAPKTAAGRRTVSLPATTVAALRNHRIETLELRMALGEGPLPADTPVFADAEGNPLPPPPIHESMAARRAESEVAKGILPCPAAQPCVGVDRGRAGRGGGIAPPGPCQPRPDAEYLRAPVPYDRRQGCGSHRGRPQLNRVAIGLQSGKILCHRPR